jgi:HD-like signal output (HDOD) protein
VVPLNELTAEPAAGTSPSSGEVLRRKALRGLADLPPFSAILNRLMASLGGENVSFAQLGDLIEKDTVITGNVLQVVNSALYGRSGTINSVRHALSILGIDKIRNAVLGMSLTRMWNKLPVPRSWSMARFNQHSAAVSLLSDQLAQRLPLAYPEGAFVAGLLHDVGRLLIAMSLPDEHDQVQQLRERTGASRLDCELKILGFTHPTLSADALAVWNVPEPIRAAVLFHHDSAADQSTTGVSLSRVVQASNNYVNSIGVSVVEKDSGNATLIETLGLNDEALAMVLLEFRTEFDVMAQFFRG